MSLESWSLADGEPHLKVNGNFLALEALRVYGQRNVAHDGLTWGYHGGDYGGASTVDGTLTLAASATNYIVAPVAGGAPSVSTSTTNWTNSTSYRRVYAVTTDVAGPTAVVDHRTRDGGLFGAGTAGGGGGGTVTSVNGDAGPSVVLDATDVGADAAGTAAAAVAAHVAASDPHTQYLKESDGPVIGPASAVDNTLARFDGTTGKLVQGSGVVVSDTDELSGYLGKINSQTGTSYTVVVSGASTDAGKIIDHANGSAITVTLPNSAPVGFAVTYVQASAGQITFAAASGATIANRQSHTKTAGLNAMVALYVRGNAGGSAAAWVLGGDTAA